MKNEGEKTVRVIPPNIPASRRSRSICQPPLEWRLSWDEHVLHRARRPCPLDHTATSTRLDHYRFLGKRSYHVRTGIYTPFRTDACTQLIRRTTTRSCHEKSHLRDVHGGGLVGDPLLLRAIGQQDRDLLLGLLREALLLLGSDGVELGGPLLQERRVRLLLSDRTEPNQNRTKPNQTKQKQFIPTSEGEGPSERTQESRGVASAEGCEDQQVYVDTNN